MFYYDSEEGLFIGGNFWDGRATGERLGDPAAEQALGPFLNPVEQNNAGKTVVLEKIAGSNYAWLWEVVWGEPLTYETPEQIERNYDRVGLSISAYEASPEVSPFSSKFDYYLEGLAELTEEEMLGLELFNGKGLCGECHISTGPNPLFTDFTFDNLGVPKNPENPFYDMDKILLDDGTPINPQGAEWIDKGLGGFLESSADPFLNSKAEENMGKHKVPTLRNVDKRPGNGFKKAYMHNGVFKSLKEVVHFYNTRDVGDWPPPEVAENVNTDELGNLGLTDEEEDAIVAFMATLSDAYQLPGNTPLITMPSSTTNGALSLRVLGPGPFNDFTRLVYYLPEEAPVQLDVFNLSGQMVKTIASGQRAGGEYQVDLPTNDLGSGVFFIRLRAGNQVVTEKMTCVK